MKRLLPAVLFALFAGCETLDENPLGLEPSFTRIPKVAVCHYRTGQSDWKLLQVGQPAVSAHRKNHDDAVPGGTTSQSGTTLDADCVPQPPTPPVLITTDRTGNLEVFAMNADGSGAVNMSQNASGDDEPDWSHDGSRIVFTSTRGGQSDIYVMNADGSAVTQLTNTPERERTPSFSPDDSEILFDVFRSNRTGNVYVMNADGTNVRQLTNSAQEDRAPSWAPDGLTIAFHKSVPGNTDIWLMNPDGSNQRNLTNSSLEFNSEAHWVSNGSAFYSAAAPAGQPGTLTLFRVDANTGGLTQLTTRIAGIRDVNPILSPDGSSLLFSTNRAGGPQEVFSLDLGTLSIAQVTNAPGFSVSLFTRMIHLFSRA